MPRVLPAALDDALDNNTGDPYFLATITNSATLVVTFSGQAVGYKLSPLELTVKVQADEYIDVSPDDRLVLTRGLTISGVAYGIDTSQFHIVYSFWDGSFQIFNCHLVPEKYYTASGYDTYENIITDFCATFGKIAVFKDPAAAWLSYKFFPTGRNITLNNARKFFNTLRQKYFIFACDNGNDEILFYTAYDVNTTADNDADSGRWKIDREDSIQRRFVWRDENGTIHGSDPSFYELVEFLANPNYVVDLLRLDDDSILAANSYKYIFKSTDNGETWTTCNLATTPGGNTKKLCDLGGGVVIALLTSSAIIFRSTDYGETWTQVATLFASASFDITTDGTNVWVLGNSKVYKSTDAGLSWDSGTTIDVSIHTTESLYWVTGNILLLGGRINPAPPYVATWRSTDGGATWSRATTSYQLEKFFRIGTDVYGIDTYIGAGTFYIYKSTDNGATWALFANDNAFEKVVPITDTYWIAYFSDSFYKSTDGGTTWESLVIGVGVANFLDAIHLQDDKLLLANFQIGAYSAELYIFDAANIQEYPVHNLGYLESTDSAPNRNTSFIQPTFDPFPVHLKHLSGDHITINLLPTSEVFEVRRAEIIEELNLEKNYIPWRIYIAPTDWLSTTEAGSLPSTIEAAAPYTPLATIGFNNNLDANVNNLQALAEAVDDLPILSFDDAEGDPADVAGSASDGTSTFAARRDHVHAGATAGHTHTSEVSDAAYGSGWNGDTTHAPSKNAVYDKIELVAAGMVTNGDAHDHSGGDGGQIAYTSLSAKPAMYVSSTLLYDAAGQSTSGFTGTIATLPGGAVLTYTPVSGNEDTLNPSATTYAAKQRLYNTTRGTYALISSNNAGTNTLTLTGNVPAGWTVGDTITTLSPTVSGGGFNWVDLEITSGAYLNKTFVMLSHAITDTGGAGGIIRFHPYETYNGAKVVAQRTQSAQRLDTPMLYLINSNVITVSWVATGAGTFTPQIKQQMVFE